MNESPASETVEAPSAQTAQGEAPAPSADSSAAPVTDHSAELVVATEAQSPDAQPQAVVSETPGHWARTQSFINDNSNAVIFGGGVLFLLIVLWLVARARKAELGLFRNASGRVSVSRNALADLVETVARGVPGTVKPRAFFRKRGGLLNVKLRLRLKGRRRLTGFTDDLQERITAALKDALGEDQIGQVDIIVTGFYDLGTREQRPDDTSAEVEENMKDVI